MVISLLVGVSGLAHGLTYHELPESRSRHGSRFNWCLIGTIFGLARACHLWICADSKFLGAGPS